VKLNFKLRSSFNYRLPSEKNIILFSMALVLFIFILSSCLGAPTLNGNSIYQDSKERISITSRDLVFDSLEKKWISSTYFDRGMKYEGSQLEVISLSDLLKKYSPDKNLDAILLNCADDYQGIISINDVKNYDLQIALKIELPQGSVRPDWLQPLLIVVPNHAKPPFSERFFTANITELRFVRLADYYAPLESLDLRNAYAQFGLELFKDNCLFCHSIKKVGGNKGTSLLSAFDLMSGGGKNRFKEKFFKMHGRGNITKQNTGQFLTNDQFDALLEFLDEISANN